MLGLPIGNGHSCFCSPIQFQVLSMFQQQERQCIFRICVYFCLVFLLDCLHVHGVLTKIQRHSAYSVILIQGVCFFSHRGGLAIVLMACSYTFHLSFVHNYSMISSFLVPVARSIATMAFSQTSQVPIGRCYQLLLNSLACTCGIALPLKMPKIDV